MARTCGISGWETLSETFGGKDADEELTGMYLQRVSDKVSHPLILARKPESAPATITNPDDILPPSESGAGMNKQIICINWGTKYGPKYINRLYGMVARNITPPFRFVCFCDNAEGIREEVECLPLPGLSFELPVTKKGIWPKSQLWNEKLANLEGPVLFIDLDVVITGNLDAFFEYGNEDDVILAPNPSNPLERLGQTSVYRFPVGKLKPILDLFASDPQKIAEEYKYEQRFVTRNAPGGIKLWPKYWVSHFRRHCRRTFPLNYFLPPKLHNEARIVIFPGDLHPEDAINGFYYRSVQIRRTPWEHIKAGLRGDRKSGFVKHLRHYILPTPWVEEKWKE